MDIEQILKCAEEKYPVEYKETIEGNIYAYGLSKMKPGKKLQNILPSKNPMGKTKSFTNHRNQGKLSIG